MPRSLVREVRYAGEALERWLFVLCVMRWTGVRGRVLRVVVSGARNTASGARAGLVATGIDVVLRQISRQGERQDGTRWGPTVKMQQRRASVKNSTSRLQTCELARRRQEAVGDDQKGGIAAGERKR